MKKYSEIVCYKCEKCGKEIHIPRHSEIPKDKHIWKEVKK